MGELPGCRIELEASRFYVVKNDRKYRHDSLTDGRFLRFGGKQNRYVEYPTRPTPQQWDFPGQRRFAAAFARMASWLSINSGIIPLHAALFLA
jgi:hypothetical protein